MTTLFQPHSKYKLTITPTEARIKYDAGCSEDFFIKFSHLCYNLINEYVKQGLTKTVRGMIKGDSSILEMYFGENPKRVFWMSKGVGDETF